jgi:hypothetical protein
MNLEQMAFLSCQGYATSLRTLAALRRNGRLSEDQIRTVDDVRPVLNTACAQPPSDATAETIVTQTARLVAIQMSARGGAR